MLQAETAHQMGQEDIPLHGTVSRSCVVGALFLLVQHLGLAHWTESTLCSGWWLHSFLTKQLFMSMEEI